MSKDAGLYFTFNNFDTIEFINLLQNAGWSFNDNGKKSYLPLGDDDFEWSVFTNISEKELRTILEQKVILGELVGVVMTWKNTNIGGNFLIYNNGEVTFSLSINPVLFEEMNLVNVSWYLERTISPILNSKKISLINYEYREHY